MGVAPGPALQDAVIKRISTSPGLQWIFLLNRFLVHMVRNFIIGPDMLEMQICLQLPSCPLNGSKSGVITVPNDMHCKIKAFEFRCGHRPGESNVVGYAKFRHPRHSALRPVILIWFRHVAFLPVYAEYISCASGSLCSIFGGGRGGAGMKASTKKFAFNYCVGGSLLLFFSCRRRDIGTGPNRMMQRSLTELHFIAEL